MRTQFLDNILKGHTPAPITLGFLCKVLAFSSGANQEMGDLVRCRTFLTEQGGVLVDSSASKGPTPATGVGTGAGIASAVAGALRASRNTAGSLPKKVRHREGAVPASPMSLAALQVDARATASGRQQITATATDAGGGGGVGHLTYR